MKGNEANERTNKPTRRTPVHRITLRISGKLQNWPQLDFWNLHESRSTDDTSDPLVNQLWIQHIGWQLNTLQLNKWNPGRNRWTGLQRQGSNWTVRSTPARPNWITEEVNLQVPDRVPKYRSDRTADRRLNPQQIHKHHRRNDNSRDTMQKSSSHLPVTKTEVSWGRFTNLKSCLVHVDPHAPGIHTREYTTR